MGDLIVFKNVIVHQGDKGLIKTTIKINCLKEKDLIEIGDYCFEVIEIPGHHLWKYCIFRYSEEIINCW